MANYNQNNRQDHSDDSLSGCLSEVTFGCLFDLLLSGIGCIVPTLLVAFMLAYGAKASAQPVKRLSTRMVARIQRLRQRPAVRLRFSTISRLNSAPMA